MSEMVFKDLARELMIPMYSGVRVQYEDSKLAGGRTEKMVMIALADQGRMYPSQLCRKVHASSPRMAVILRDLEERKWVTRIADAKDSRKSAVECTAEGFMAAEEFRETLEEQMTQSLELLGEEDAREYVRLQKKLTEAMERPKKPGRFSK